MGISANKLKTCGFPCNIYYEIDDGSTLEYMLEEENVSTIF